MRSVQRIVAVLALLGGTCVVSAQGPAVVSKIYLGGATITNPGGTAVSIGAGLFTAGTFSGSCSLCTSVPAGQLTGTIPSGVQDNITRLGTVTNIGGWSAHLLPTASDVYDLGSPFKLWRLAYVSQMNATLFAKETQSLFGGWFAVSKNAGVFPSNVTAAATTINFGMTMTPNQFVVVRAADNNSGAITSEFIKVGTLVSGTTYNVTRNLSGLGAKEWAEGTPFQVRGVAGDGWLEMNAFDTPRLSVFTQGSLYSNSTENLRLGHLTGMPNSSSGIGIYIGDATNYLRYDSTNFKLVSASTTVDSSGITIEPGALAAPLNAYKFRRRYASGSFGQTGDLFGLSGYDLYPLGNESWLEVLNKPVGLGTGAGGTSAKANAKFGAYGWDPSGGGSSTPETSISFVSNPSGISGVTITGNTSVTGTLATTGAITERSRSVAMGEWASYTPTWAASGTAVSLGNGTLTAKYTLIGKTVHYEIQLTAGSTTTFGTGFWTFTLPTTAANANHVGNAYMNDVSNAFYDGATKAASTSTIFIVYFGTTGGVGSTAPFTWGTGDVLYISGTYETS